MATFNDQAIVLRRVDYGETDRILTVMTKDHGKVGVIARGVRKPRSRLAAHTDLFTRMNAQFATGRGELLVLAQATTTPPIPSSSDPTRLACAAVCTELVDRAVETGLSDALIFQLLSHAVE